MSIDYKEKYTVARNELISYLEIEDQQLIDDEEGLPLIELTTIVINKYNEASLLNSLITIAYQQRVPFDKVDDYLQSASVKLNEMEESGELDNEVIEALAREFAAN